MQITYGMCASCEWSNIYYVFDNEKYVKTYHEYTYKINSITMHFWKNKPFYKLNLLHFFNWKFLINPYHVLLLKHRTLATKNLKLNIYIRRLVN